jgi:hypothetical protein
MHMWLRKRHYRERILSTGHITRGRSIASIVRACFGQLWLRRNDEVCADCVANTNLPSQLYTQLNFALKLFHWPDPFSTQQGSRQKW